MLQIICKWLILNYFFRFAAEIQDLLSWLSDIDSVIAASKPVGGLPETASEQLERFMVSWLLLFQQLWNKKRNLQILLLLHARCDTLKEEIEMNQLNPAKSNVN